jgi:surface carbohydrate biosynthesis protein
MNSIALPIEGKVRELDGKLWLGLNFVDRGYDVTIGPSWELKYVLDTVDPDIYFTKDPGDGNIEFLKELRNAGISVCGLAPEVGVNSSEFMFAENRQNSLEYMDMYFCWGETTATALRTYYNDQNRDKIKVTGNPRFDLVTEELRSVYSRGSEKLHGKYGNYLLMNTSFGIGNPINREHRYAKIKESYSDRNLHKERLVESEILYSFVRLVFHLLSVEIVENIVIRPHPGEDHSTYQDIFESYDNVYVEHYGDVRPWILGSIGVIHYNCTTGVEAALLETPVLSYQEVTQQLDPKPLSQIASYEVTSTAEGVEWVKDCSKHDRKHTMNTEQKEQLRGYFPNIDQLAAPKVCDAVDQLEPISETSSRYTYTTKEKIERSVKHSPVGPQVTYVYDIMNDLLGEGNHREGRKNRKQKFSELTSEELYEKSQFFLDKIDLDSVSVSKIPLTEHTFRIRSTD